MKIVGLEGLTTDQVRDEVARGARFVYYTYAISIIILTFRRSSAVYFLKAGESRVVRGLGYTFISLLFGWWGIPWGPIYTIGSFMTNFGGGKDVTAELLAAS